MAKISGELEGVRCSLHPVWSRGHRPLSVRQALIRIATLLLLSVAFAACRPAPDTAQRLANRLATTNGSWEDGLFPKIELASSASPEEVAKAVLEQKNYGAEKYLAHEFLRTEQIAIPGSTQSRYIAVTVRTNHGYKIVLLAHLGRSLDERSDTWWSRVFSASGVDWP